MSLADKKRNRSDDFEGIEAESIGRNKKVLRSPNLKLKKGGEEMDSGNLERMFKMMMEQMMVEMRKNTEELKVEIKNMREEMKEREKKWNEEKKMLEKRIEVLEDKAEREEKRRKKNNIVVKNLAIEVGKEKEEIQAYIENELKTKVEIKGAYRINRGSNIEMFVAEVGSWEQKQQVMKKKHNLKGKKTIIENDLTPKERQIQKQILEIGKVERDKERNVKIGYHKITIDGTLYVWDEKEQGVKEQNVTRNRGNSSKN